MVRAQIVSELNGERDAFSSYISSIRKSLAETVEQSQSQLAELGGDAEELNTAYESYYEKEKETSNYLYEKYIVLDLEVQINAFGQNKLAKFTAATEALLDAGQIKLLS